MTRFLSGGVLSEEVFNLDFVKTIEQGATKINEYGVPERKTRLILSTGAVRIIDRDFDEVERELCLKVTPVVYPLQCLKAFEDAEDFYIGEWPILAIAWTFELSRTLVIPITPEGVIEDDGLLCIHDPATGQCWNDDQTFPNRNAFEIWARQQIDRAIERRKETKP